MRLVEPAKDRNELAAKARSGHLPHGRFWREQNRTKKEDSFSVFLCGKAFEAFFLCLCGVAHRPVFGPVGNEAKRRKSWLFLFFHRRLIGWRARASAGERV